MSAQTIFVGSLPASATNERLVEIFSDIGPVKQCFVVREKGSEKCRGFGYVTYSMAEDAQRALKEIKEFDGQRLSLSVAKKKIQDRKKPASEDPAAAPKQNQQKTSFRKNKLKARLIIRNLSFKCSEEDLKQVCGKFGIVLEAKIPLKPDGKMRGFAFVQFQNVSGAAKALNGLNLTEIKGRKVAVDWAVPKDQFISTRSSSAAENKSTVEETTKQEDAESDADDEDEEKTQAESKKTKFASKPAAQQVEESQSDDEDDSEEQEIDQEDSEDEDGDSDDDDDDESSLCSNDQNESDSGDEDDDDDDEEAKSAQKKASRKLLPSDVKEGRTIFIRNLSFDTEEEGLEEALLRYGELTYIKIVIHPDTEHSKGCAFAQFKTKEAADRCVAAAQEESESGGVRVDGRKLFIVTAVSREDVTKLKVNKEKVETGTRNLYLAREGLVRAGTKAAEGVSEADMIKRARFEELKRAKLRSINIYVSKTRLCVHNLPKSVNDKKLKDLCLQAVKGNKRFLVTECRVMYDKKPVKGQVTGQSLGYGFVQFRDHEHALSTLRYLNNNPDIFASQKRPIVEFSLEDSKKLKMKEMRQQKQKAMAKNRSFMGGKPQSRMAGDGKGPRKEEDKVQSSIGKKRAPPLQQNKDGHYSGFVTKQEVEHIDLENGKKRRKVLAFPSHHGPKIRMRDKGKQKVPPPKKAKPGSSRKQHQRCQIEKPTQSRNQKVKTAKKHFKSGDGDSFDHLVDQYKKKLMGYGDKISNMKRNKWFDS
ncbi:RNA-binding protein 28 [Brachionichthys hirsutus]|uniref:RNA-binding protein 28 n=1 Tax=Brachionichthys hirsutus TaxID=412623 RepID=UPI0036049483